MNHNRILKQIGRVLLGQMIFLLPIGLFAADDAEETEEVKAPLVSNMENGMALFQGEQSFHNGGPSCIVCHSVTNDDVIPGGLFAKDLTDVYSRLGEGLVGWLTAPPFAPMAASYNNNPLTEQERIDLTAFFKHANDSKDQIAKSGHSYMLIGGGIGMIILLGLVQLLWSRRKSKMVKEDIFSRQNKAFDAKF